MSNMLQIKFEEDMPQATVEIVAPDLSTIGRIWLEPGQQRSVEVPSGDSFLRLHLPSGEILTLQDPGNLDRTIGRSALTDRLAHSRSSDVRPRLRVLSARRVSRLRDLFGSPASFVAEGRLEGGFKVRLRSSLNTVISCEVREPGISLLFRPPTSTSPYELAIDAPEMLVRVRVPGMIEELVVRSDAANSGRPLVKVRVRTLSSTADAVGAYVNRGDLHSAAVLADWAENSEALLSQKQENPFAAAVGAYLLLRLRRFDLLHDWTLNLANWFPEISDGSVIRAWHQIYTGGSESEIRELLFRAAQGKLPVFTEGLRLLSDGARLLGADSKQAVEDLNRRSGEVLWRSPFTATVQGARSDGPTEAVFDIDYAPKV